MGIAVKNTTSVAIEEEVTEGTYVAPSSASKYVQTLQSGLEIKPAKELLERNVFAGTIGKVTPRTGMKSVSGSIPTECRAFSTAGSAPEYDSLMKSALGTKRQSTSAITTKGAGNTGSVLQIQDADIAALNIGDIVLVKEAGAYHVSPISARDATGGAANVTLLIPKPAGSFSNSVVIEKFTTYTVAETGHPTLSITKYLDSLIEDKAWGCRVNKLALQNFATGKIPEFNFGFDGLNFDRSIHAPTYSPSYDSALPPIVLDAKAYIDTGAIVVNDISITIENKVGFSTSISASNGKISSRVVERKITGSMNPYEDDTSVANFTKFVNNTEFSLFAYAKNDSGVAGEFKNVVALYMPKCLITEIHEGEADGLVQESIAFTSSRGSTGTTNEIYICFI